MFQVDYDGDGSGVPPGQQPGQGKLSRSDVGRMQYYFVGHMEVAGVPQLVSRLSMEKK